MPQRTRTKALLNASINTKVLNEIEALLMTFPRDVIKGKSALVELLLKKGLEHKQEIQKELLK